MKLRKILLITLVCALVLTLSMMGALFAYMYQQTGEVTNTFIPANVSCLVNETFSVSTKSSITVQNTSNIAAYLRVRMVSYWVDENGAVMPVASEMPGYSVASGWVSLGNHTYCYRNPVDPGASTPELLASSMVLQRSEEGYRQVVEVFAEAIQANPADAVKVWSVTVNADGSIG